VLTGFEKLRNCHANVSSVQDVVLNPTIKIMFDKRSVVSVREREKKNNNNKCHHEQHTVQQVLYIMLRTTTK